VAPDRVSNSELTALNNCVRWRSILMQEVCKGGRVDKMGLARIAAELLALSDQARAAGSRGTAFMIIAAARQAEKEAGALPLADRALDGMLAEEPDEPPLGYDIDGG
jgi:hypothetical protein